MVLLAKVKVTIWISVANSRMYVCGFFKFLWRLKISPLFVCISTFLCLVCGLHLFEVHFSFTKCVCCRNDCQIMTIFCCCLATKNTAQTTKMVNDLAKCFFFLFLNLYVCILHQCDCIFLKIYAILKTKQHLVPLEEVRKRRKYSDSQRNNEALEKQKEREKLKETKISAAWLCLSCKYRCLLNDVVQITRAAMFTRIYRPQNSNRLYRQSMCHFKDFGWFHLNHNDKITIIFSVSILFLSHKKKSEKKKNISQLWITPKSSSLKGFTAKVAS